VTRETFHRYSKKAKPRTSGNNPNRHLPRRLEVHVIIRDVITNYVYICLTYVKCCGDNVPVIVMNYIWRSVYGLITDYIHLLT
jgi:hypothetical protein